MLTINHVPKMHTTWQTGFPHFLHTALWAVLATLSRCQDDILGCGGFVRPISTPDGAKKPDLSGVKAKLYTRSGLLKGETECAPNGYYYIPIYDRGTYLIRVEGPPGWIFEPVEQEVSSSEDGLCGQGKDIDFSIVGFALSGRVCSDGFQTGPQGVKLELAGPSGSKYRTETGPDGLFSFKDAPPGTYRLTASHPKWKFRKSTVETTMAFGQAEVRDTFGVLGYDLAGVARWDNGDGYGSPLTPTRAFASYMRAQHPLSVRLKPRVRAASPTCPSSFAPRPRHPAPRSSPAPHRRRRRRRQARGVQPRRTRPGSTFSSTSPRGNTQSPLTRPALGLPGAAAAAAAAAALRNVAAPAIAQACTLAHARAYAHTRNHAHTLRQSSRARTRTNTSARAQAGAGGERDGGNGGARLGDGAGRHPGTPAPAPTHDARPRTRMRTHCRVRGALLAVLEPLRAHAPAAPGHAQRP